MEAIANPVIVDAALEAKRAKQKQYRAAYKAAHPEAVKEAKRRWHVQAREKEIARRAEIYQRAMQNPEYVERRRQESRAYALKNKEKVAEYNRQYAARKKEERLVAAAQPQARV